MAIVICMDGLGGHPDTTFKALRQDLELNGHTVIYADIEGIETHEDRIQRVLCEYHAAKSFGEKIFFAGQSAGGSAVRIAASRLRGEKELAGIVTLSQAMPRFVWFMSRQLWKNMRERIIDLLCARTIHTTEEEYARLVLPLSAEELHEAMSHRQALPGRESRKLAFYPDALSPCEFPMLVVYGDKDQWISLGAHRKLCRLLREKCPSVTTLEVSDAGHLTLASSMSCGVIMAIREWIERF